MQIAALIILIVFYCVGFGAIFFTSVGTLIIMTGAVIYALLTGFEVLSFSHIGMILGLYFTGEIFEFFLGFWGARRFGASRQAAWAGMLGGLIGALIGSLFLGVGAFIGTLMGIFTGVLVVEMPRHKDWKRAMTAGTGGILGRLGAIVTKVVLALLMGGIMIYDIIQHMERPF